MVHQRLALSLALAIFVAGCVTDERSSSTATTQATQQPLRKLRALNYVFVLPEDQYDRVMAQVDPRDQLDIEVRTLAGLKGVYDYYLSRGDSTEAMRTVASIVAKAESTAAIYEGNAKYAIQQGGPIGNFLKNQYETRPDSPFHPKYFVGAAMGAREPTALWNQLRSQAAVGRSLPAPRTAPEPQMPTTTFCDRLGDIVTCNTM